MNCDTDLTAVVDLPSYDWDDSEDDTVRVVPVGPTSEDLERLGLYALHDGSGLR